MQFRSQEKRDNFCLCDDETMYSQVATHKNHIIIAREEYSFKVFVLRFFCVFVFAFKQYWGGGNVRENLDFFFLFLTLEFFDT